MAAPGVDYVALLRGINVGGRNIVRMAELRAAFEELGFEDVTTYIQSGNVLFRTAGRKRTEIAARLEAELSERFGTELKVVLLEGALMQQVLDEAPAGFGRETHRCDVIFIREPLTVERALEVAETKEGVDEVWPGPGVLYFARLEAKASSSRLSKIVGKPEYKEMTIRNWRTTTRLAEMLRERSR